MQKRKYSIAIGVILAAILTISFNPLAIASQNDVLDVPGWDELIDECPHEQGGEQSETCVEKTGEQRLREPDLFTAKITRCPTDPMRCGSTVQLFCGSQQQNSLRSPIPAEVVLAGPVETSSRVAEQNLPFPDTVYNYKMRPSILEY